MEKQLIISIGREFGCHGLTISEALAERFNLPLYDSNLLEHVAEEKNVHHAHLKKYDELPRTRVITRRVRGYSSSLRENVADMQFKFLKDRAAEGQSFIVVGRCSDSVLKGYPGLVTIFLLGDREDKARRVMKDYHLSEEDAKNKMDRVDRGRKMYHNYYCKGKWGDSRCYDLSVNVSRMGTEKTIDFLENYIKERVKGF